MTHRFADAGQRLERFSHHFLVHCPRCDRCAQVARMDEGRALPVRLVCTVCGYTKSYEHNYWIVGDMPVDWFFRLPLWLQTPCCGHTLWAYNYEHLDYVDRYVRVELRMEEPYQNGSLASRLPAWLKSAKHRDDVLRCITRLKMVSNVSKGWGYRRDASVTPPVTRLASGSLIAHARPRI